MASDAKMGDVDGEEELPVTAHRGGNLILGDMF